MCYFGAVGRARAWHAKGHGFESQRARAFWQTLMNTHKCCATHTYKDSAVWGLLSRQKKHYGLDLIIPSTNVQWLKKTSKEPIWKNQIVYKGWNKVALLSVWLSKNQRTTGLSSSSQTKWNESGAYSASKMKHSGHEISYVDQNLYKVFHYSSMGSIRRF